MPRPIERLSALGLSKLAKRKGVFCDVDCTFTPIHLLSVPGFFAIG
jgi:hypothetical protein